MVTDTGVERLQVEHGVPTLKPMSEIYVSRLTKAQDNQSHTAANHPSLECGYATVGVLLAGHRVPFRAIRVLSACGRNHTSRVVDPYCYRIAPQFSHTGKSVAQS